VILTPREREVLGLVARGRSRKLVALELAIAQHTVNAHLGRAYVKLGAHNATGAVSAARAQGELL
jgi:DNA-binding CsgD family transcriptional regulator